MKKLRMISIVSVLLLFAAGVMAGSAMGAEEKKETVTGGVASAEDMTTVDEVVADWMVPVRAEELADGSWDISVSSSSSMFKIAACTLKVDGGRMQAVLTMSGTSYLYLYPGKAEEAAAADKESLISYVEDEDGAYTFTVPVDALDAGTDCAAFSRRKELWYDRTLVFLASSLPMEAWKNPPMTTVEELELADGMYWAEGTLSGGSGRTTIETPVAVTVTDGSAIAEIIFSSSNYDYVLVDGEKYETVNMEGNSTFLIPVAGFDYNMPIVADTIAMSRPYEIEYTIYLDSATLSEENPQKGQPE